MQILSRRTKNNPVLIGEPGVSKTAIVEALAQRIIKNDVPASLKNKRLINLEISSLVAGASFRGQFEERLKAALKKLTRPRARSSCSSTRSTPWLAQAAAKAAWTQAIS